MFDKLLSLVNEMRTSAKRKQPHNYLITTIIWGYNDEESVPYGDHRFNEEAFEEDLKKIEEEIHRLIAERDNK